MKKCTERGLEEVKYYEACHDFYQILLNQIAKDSESK